MNHPKISPFFKRGTKTGFYCGVRRPRLTPAERPRNSPNPHSGKRSASGNLLYLLWCQAPPPDTGKCSVRSCTPTGACDLTVKNIDRISRIRHSPDIRCHSEPAAGRAKNLIPRSLINLWCQIPYLKSNHRSNSPNPAITVNFNNFMKFRCMNNI